MKITKFWIVRNPSENSTLEDILTEINDISDFIAMVRGSPEEIFDENWCIYSSLQEAMRDASLRFVLYKELIRTFTKK